MQRGDISVEDQDRLVRAREGLELAGAELRAAVVRARRNGGSIRVIADVVGVSPTTVHKWIRDA